MSKLRIVTAIATLALTAASMRALAADPTPEIAASKSCKEISLTSESEILKYLPGFHISKKTDETGTHLEFTGFVHKDCPNVHIDMEHGNEAHPGIHALHIWRTDRLGENGATVADAASCAGKAKLCNIDNPDCVEVKKSSVIRASAAENFPNESGVVRLVEQACGLTPDHPDYIKIEKEVPAKFGGPFEYKTPAQIAKENKEAKLKAENELVKST